MNRKTIWLALPALLNPYIILLALAILFCSPDNPICAAMMEHLFANNALMLGAVVLWYEILAFLLSAVCMILGICKAWDAVSLSKTTLLLKLIQIPAHVMIFILAVACMITIFTIPFTLLLLILDYLTLMMSGLFTSTAVINAIRQRKTSFRQSFWVILLQFISCADVVAAFIFYTKLKKQSHI